MADILSIPGIMQNKASAPSKKAQSEPENVDGSAKVDAETTNAAFNPILAQMMGSTQAKSFKKDTESCGKPADAPKKSSTVKGGSESVSAAFVSRELKKMAGSVQGQNVLQSVLTVAANVEGAMSSSAKISQEVTIIATGGEAKISIAKDPGLSPSDVVEASIESSVGLMIAPKAMSKTVPLNQAITDEPQSVKPTVASVSQASPGDITLVQQNLTALAPGQVLTSGEQSILSAFAMREVTKGNETSQNKGQDSQNTNEVAANQLTVSVVPDSLDLAKGALPSFVGAPGVKSQRQGQSDAAVEPAIPLVIAGKVQPSQGIVPEKSTGLGLLGMIKSMYSGGGMTVERESSPQKNEAPNPAPGKPELAQSIPGNVTDELASMAQVNQELLTIVQSKLGLTAPLNSVKTLGKQGASAKNDAQAEGSIDVTTSERTLIANAKESERVPLKQVLLGSETNDSSSSSNITDKGGKAVSALAGGKIGVQEITTEFKNVNVKASNHQPAENPAAPVKTDTSGVSGVLTAEVSIAGATETGSEGSIPAFAGTNPDAKSPSPKSLQLEDEDKQTNPVKVSDTNNPRQDSIQKPAVDTKGPSAAVTSLKEHAESFRNQVPVLHTGVDRQEATATPLPKLVTLPPELLSSIQNQVASEFSLKLLDNASEMKMVLKPESLGEVSINVRMEEGSMVARINVSQNQVRMALEATLPQLRDALASKGIRVDRIDILTSSDSSSRESSNQSREKSKSSSRRRADVESIDAYDSTRYLGYNTMEYLI